MKKLIIKASFVIGLVFLMDFAFGLVLKYLYFNQKSGTTNHIIRSVEVTDRDILVFGTSRAQHTYIPDSLQAELNMSCYNVGQAGMNIFVSLAILKSVTARYTPEIILLEVFPIDLLTASAKEYERLSYLLPFYDSHTEIRDIINLRGPFERFKLLSKIYPYNSHIVPIIYNNLFKQDYDYFDGYMPLREKMHGFAKTQMAYQFTPDANKIAAFNRFLEIAQNSGSKVYAIISPFYILENDAYQAAHHLTLNVLQNHHVPLWDYSGDARFNNPELYKDPIHLNFEGAQLFSGLVAQRLRADILQPGSIAHRSGK